MTSVEKSNGFDGVKIALQGFSFQAPTALCLTGSNRVFRSAGRAANTMQTSVQDMKNREMIRAVSITFMRAARAPGI
jgi:hypothetical protein